MSSSMAKTCPKSATGPGRTKSPHFFKDSANGPVGGYVSPTDKGPPILEG